MVGECGNELIFELLCSSLCFIQEEETEEKVKDAFLKLCNDNEKANRYITGLYSAKEELKSDLSFFLDSDPAVISEEEVIMAYPGYKAIAFHRIAYILKEMGFGLEARIISEKAHSETGIDIHPGAKISSPFFIDHGTGIVIGETAVIGKNVKIYQGVTLGALSLSNARSLKGKKRHPTIGNNVTIYSGASILGDIKIGDNVTIGSNVFLTEDVPSDMRVIIPKPELILKKK